ASAFMAASSSQSGVSEGSSPSVIGSVMGAASLNQLGISSMPLSAGLMASSPLLIHSNPPSSASTEDTAVSSAGRISSSQSGESLESSLSGWSLSSLIHSKPLPAA